MVDNWESSGFKVTSVNSSEEANIFRTADVEVLGVESYQNRLKITEIMSAIADTGTPIAGFINADCRLRLMHERPVALNLVYKTGTRI